MSADMIDWLELARVAFNRRAYEEQRIRGGEMPAYPGISYKPKSKDYMGRVIVRKCPTCGAAAGELCILASGKNAMKVTEVHSARFVRRDHND